GRRRGAVTGHVGGLGGDLLQHLRAHVLELVLELDLLGDGDAVLGGARRAEALLEHHVAALGAQRHLDGIGENIDAAQHALARVLGEAYVFGCHCRILSWGSDTLRLTLRKVEEGAGKGAEPRPACDQAAARTEAFPSITPRMSLSFMMRSSSPSIFTSVPDHLPNSTRSPFLTSGGTSRPCSSRAPGPTAMTSPCMGFSLAVSGMMIPPLVFMSSSMRRTTTRSCRGRNFMGQPRS